MSLFHHLFLPHHTNNQRAKILHPSALSIIIGCFAVFQVLIGQVITRFPDILGYASQIPAGEIVQLTNSERQTRGLSQLRLDPGLSAAALQKASDMFARNYWAHVSPSGVQPWFFITQAGYTYRYAGENLARDFSDPKSIVQAWLNSPTHRDNLLNSRYEDIGVAVVDGTLEGKDTTLVVQMFGTKLASAPAVGGRSASVVAKAQEPPQPTIVPTPIPTTAVAAQPGLPAAAAYLTSIEETPKNFLGISPFEITKYTSLALLGLFAVVLLIDVIVVNRRKITRWTSKSFAHLVFIIILIIAAGTILRGRIL